ncbi:IS3 family transposase [Cytophagales bacterium LB-30]|uniref:IS3 family transposase n=1 Tax=Shiella aurantiaca TaxID=3058365 RepID=A0ABT8F549_9BACT|nr:IS3 family transposase [Shiella aurantiaca]MDN4165503.1 IS3 family transposase [Shiella aurantiaca]
MLEMKDVYPRISLARLCRLLGITRQAYYQHYWEVSDITIEHQLILDRVVEIRQVHPAIGGRKLLYLLQPFLLEHQIKMGRDALFDLLAANKLLVRKRKRRISTTQSHHWLKKYPNLVKDWHPSKPNELWVSDITYIPLMNGFLYLSLVTDAYSHKIMGYAVADNLEAINTTKALDMALSNLTEVPGFLIHHSDRGIQYCSFEYVNTLKQNNIKISMTENGDPLENPVAERINGILKEEYLRHYPLTNLNQVIALVDDVVDRYNRLRPHQSINMVTPEVVHEKQLLINRTWSKKKQYVTL